MAGPDNPTPPTGPGRYRYDLDAVIKVLVDSAPRLTAEQRARLSALLAPVQHADERQVA